MLFQFNRWNHCRQGQIIVEDITRIMSAQIQALGHQAVTSEGPFIGRSLGYNVILEAFEDQTHVQAIADASPDCNFIIVATEEPTDDGFNHGLEPAMIKRQNAFPAAAKYASGILHLVPGAHVTQWYSQFAPAAAAELGFSPHLLDLRPQEPPAYDFGFYGKMTWRRKQMIDRLDQISSTAVLLIDTLDVPWKERDAMMRRCRVIVQIRANDEWGMVSSTRCASALHFGRPIVAEPHPAPEPWDGVVTFSPSVEAFYHDAMVATRCWTELHASQLEKFAAKLTPEFCIGAPLRAIGINL